MTRVSEEEYLDHIARKTEAQNEKNNDKTKALDGQCHTICCDLMQVQTLPVLAASSSYYKLKLMIHNYTVYNLATRDVISYWFDETDANLSASTFASLLVDYISELLKTSKLPVMVFSDGCNYQNRNAILSNALLDLSMT